MRTDCRWKTKTRKTAAYLGASSRSVVCISEISEEGSILLITDRRDLRVLVVGIVERHIVGERERAKTVRCIVAETDDGRAFSDAGQTIGSVIIVANGWLS